LAYSKEEQAQQWAYWAGFLDGEGCFRIDGGQQPHHGTTKIRVANCYLPVLEEFQEFVKQITGTTGSIRRNGRRQSVKHRLAWQLLFSGKTCRRVVREVLPFLKEKKTQADLLLKWPKLNPDDPRRLTLKAELTRLKHIEYDSLTEKSGDA